MGDIYYHFKDAVLHCPVCGRQLEVSVKFPRQDLSDQTTGYNNQVKCDCGFYARLGYNGGWGANRVVVCSKKDSYYGVPALDWHDNDGVKSQEEITEWIQKRLNEIS